MSPILRDSFFISIQYAVMNDYIVLQFCIYCKKHETLNAM